MGNIIIDENVFNPEPKEGGINDNISTNSTTYSSQKINALNANKMSLVPGTSGELLERDALGNPVSSGKKIADLAPALHSHPSDQVTLNTTNFGGILPAVGVETLQQLADFIDDNIGFGRQVELQASVTHLQWKYVGEIPWNNLIALSSLQGPQGPTGVAGNNGREVELQTSGGVLQWRYVGDTVWNNIYTFPTSGVGDMTKAVYDTTDAGYVDATHRTIISFINKTGATLTKGTIVYLNSTSSSANFPEALKANASTETTSSKTIGAVYEDVSDNGTGFLVTSGEVKNLNTASYNVGDKLWLATTDGNISTTRPTPPNHAVFIGTVTRSHGTQGRVSYSIMNGYELDELHDTSFTSLNNDDFLQRKLGLWVNRTPSQVKTELGVISENDIIAYAVAL